MTILNKDLKDIQTGNMLKYMFYIMRDRSISDVRDGLKPVHRRILYTMYEDGYTNNKHVVKSSRVVGSVLGKRHPHGDTSVYDAIVKLSQDFYQQLPMVEGSGNFGSITGDSAAAQRYTACRLDKYSEDYILDDINKNAVNFQPNYDGSDKEPEVLPTKTLNLLVNGAFGIASGFSQSIPTHNIKEVCDMVCNIIDNPDMSVDDVAKGLVPDSPTGGIITSKKDLIDGYTTGKGNFKIRAKINHNIKDNQLIITEIPYMQTLNGNDGTGGILGSILSAYKDEKLPEVKDIKDLSDKDGICIVVELKKGAQPKIVENKLYKHTSLESTFGLRLITLNGKSFKTYNIKELFEEWIKFRRKTIKRVFLYDIKKWKSRIHIQEGLLLAMNNIDDIIKMIKQTTSKQEVINILVNSYNLTKKQSASISDMKLYRLSNLQKSKITDELKELKIKVDDKLKYIRNTDLIDDVIKKEQTEVIDKFNKPRKTVIREVGGLDNEDIIPDEQVMVAITNDNYIKKIRESIKSQKRNGKGTNFGKMHDEDFVNQNFFASNKDELLLFTDKGKVYSEKLYNIDFSTKQSYGKALVGYYQLDNDENVSNCIAVSRNDKSNDKILLFATAMGYVKATKLEEYSNIRSSGLISINLSGGDHIVDVKIIDQYDDCDIFLATKNGRAIRYSKDEFRPLGRNSKGLKSANLVGDDEVISFNILTEGSETIMMVTKDGLSKRTDVDEYRSYTRTSNIKGLLLCKLNEGDSIVKALITDSENEHLMVTTSKKLLKTSIDEISYLKRPTFGSKVIDLDDDDKVLDIALV